MFTVTFFISILKKMLLYFIICKQTHLQLINHYQAPSGTSPSSTVLSVGNALDSSR